MPEVNGATQAPDNDTARIILFWDKQCNGATAGVTDILESAQYNSFNNLANKGRFKILMDKRYTLNYMTGIGTAGDQDYSAVFKHGSYYKKCNIPVEYDSTTGAITEIKSNNIGVLLIPSNGTSGFNSKFRFRFSDN